MALTDRTRSYETLFRHNADGTAAAHHQTIYEVLNDGAVIAATVNPPEPIAGPKLASVLGEVLVATLEQLQQQRELVAQKDAELETLRAQLAQQRTLVAQHEVDLEALRAQLAMNAVAPAQEGAASPV